MSPPQPRNPRRNPPQLNEHDQDGADKQLVGKGVQKLSEARNHIPLTGNMPIKKIGERCDAEKHRCKKARDLPRKIQQENDRNDEKNPGQCKLICQIEHSITRFWRQLLGFYSTTIVKGKEQNSPPQRFCFG